MRTVERFDLGCTITGAGQELVVVAKGGVFSHAHHESIHHEETIRCLHDSLYATPQDVADEVLLLSGDNFWNRQKLSEVGCL